MEVVAIIQFSILNFKRHILPGLGILLENEHYGIFQEIIYIAKHTHTHTHTHTLNVSFNIT